MLHHLLVIFCFEKLIQLKHDVKKGVLTRIFLSIVCLQGIRNQLTGKPTKSVYFIIFFIKVHMFTLHTNTLVHIQGEESINVII